MSESSHIGTSLFKGGPSKKGLIEPFSSINDETNHQQYDMLSFAMQMKEMHEQQRNAI